MHKIITCVMLIIFHIPYIKAGKYIVLYIWDKMSQMKWLFGTLRLDPSDSVPEGV